MKTKLFKIGLVIVVAMVAVINVFNSQKSVQLSDVAMANVEALAQGEGSVGCTGSYDVPNHYLSYTKETGDFTVDSAGEITIMGKKYVVGGGSAGMHITITYHLGNCDKEAPGACCNGDKIGDVINIFF